MRVSVFDLRLDGGTQPREQIIYGVVEEYAALYQAGAEMPPVVVFDDGIEKWLADGFHRVAAAKSVNLDDINADVRSGTKDDAIWFACSANQMHGQRRTSADKRRAVIAALKSSKSAGLSNRAIAEHCGVSDPFVGSVQNELLTVSSSKSTTRKGKDGKTRKTKSENQAKGGKASAKKRAESKPPPPDEEKQETPRRGPPTPSYDEVLGLAFLLPANQQQSLIRALQSRLAEAA